MTDRKDIQFTFKDVFDPDDVLSRFILFLSFARNDLFQNRKTLQIATDIPFNQGESFYYFKIGISHLREAYKLVSLFSDDPKVNDFIKLLGSENIKHYEEILRLNKEFGQPDSVISNTLKPIRDHSSHYYDSKDGKRKPAFESELIEKLKTFSNMEFHITSTGLKRNQVDYTFASEASFYLLFGADVTDNEVWEKVNELSTLNKTFIHFSESAIEQYLVSKM